MPKGCIFTGFTTHQERRFVYTPGVVYAHLFSLGISNLSCIADFWLTNCGLSTEARSQSLQAKEDLANLRSLKSWRYFWNISQPLLLPLQERNLTWWDPINLGKQPVLVQFPAFSAWLRPASPFFFPLVTWQWGKKPWHFSVQSWRQVWQLAILERWGFERFETMNIG